MVRTRPVFAQTVTYGGLQIERIYASKIFSNNIHQSTRYSKVNHLGHNTSLLDALNTCNVCFRYCHHQLQVRWMH